MPAHRADLELLGAWASGHLGSENHLHHVRDVTYAEDHSQIRTGDGPRVMASVRNLALHLYRLVGNTNIAQVTRHTAINPHRALGLIGLAP